MEQKAPPDNATGPRNEHTAQLVPMPAAAKRELSNLCQVRREMAALYHAAQRGEISTEQLRGFIYALSQIAKLIELGKLEERMEMLEKMLTAGGRTH